MPGLSGIEALDGLSAIFGRRPYYYVDATSGNDANDGRDPLRAWQTIAKVNGETFTPGDRILFKRGETWAGENGLVFPSGGTAGARITISAYGSGAAPIFSLDTQCMFQYIEYVTMSDLVVDGTNLAADQANIKVWHEARYIRIEDCEAKDGPQQGIIVQQTNGGETQADYNEIIGCTVHGIGTTQAHHGIYIETSNNLVERCDCYNNAGFGIHVYNVPATASDNIVRYCRCYDNATAAGNGSGILVGSGTGNLAHHNLCWGNKHGIHVEFNAVDTLVYNNSCYNNSANSITVEDGTGAIIRNNATLLGDWGNYNDAGTGTTASNNVFAVDPLWVNPGANDFHLQAGSPCRDAGIDVALTEDYDGVSVPQETNPAIGAYEYVA